VITRKEDNHLDFKCTQKNEKVCTFFSQNVLDKETYYSFRFSFHQETTDDRPSFWIGLINEADKDKTINHNFLQSKERGENYSINTIIKGYALTSTTNTTIVNKELEMKVHLASRTIKIAVFPK